MKYVHEIRAQHDESIKFVQMLLSQNMAPIRDFLLKQNRGPPLAAATKKRTIVLMDATGSMSSLLDKCKKTVQSMFEKVGTILEAKNNDCSLELQFAVYRNYSSGPDLLLQFSTWEANHKSLQTFMASIGVEGGQGNEAVEIGLWHVCQEDAKCHVDQVLLIGDMPPNTAEEVAAKRNGYSKGYSGTRFAASTFYKDETANLKQRGIVVNSFYVSGQCAEVAFKEIACATGGKSQPLDVNSDKGAEDLTNCVAIELLRNAGGQELVDEYKRVFMKGYTA